MFHIVNLSTKYCSRNCFVSLYLSLHTFDRSGNIISSKSGWSQGYNVVVGLDFDFFIFILAVVTEEFPDF